MDGTEGAADHVGAEGVVPALEAGMRVEEEGLGLGDEGRTYGDLDGDGDGDLDEGGGRDGEEGAGEGAFHEGALDGLFLMLCSDTNTAACNLEILASVFMFMLKANNKVQKNSHVLQMGKTMRRSAWTRIVGGRLAGIWASQFNA